MTLFLIADQTGHADKDPFGGNWKPLLREGLANLPRRDFDFVGQDWERPDCRSIHIAPERRLETASVEGMPRRSESPHLSAPTQSAKIAPQGRRRGKSVG